MVSPGRIIIMYPVSQWRCVLARNIVGFAFFVVSSVHLHNKICTRQNNYKFTRDVPGLRWHSLQTKTRTLLHNAFSVWSRTYSRQNNCTIATMAIINLDGVYQIACRGWNFQSGSFVILPVCPGSWVFTLKTIKAILCYGIPLFLALTIIVVCSFHGRPSFNIDVLRHNAFDWR